MEGTQVEGDQEENNQNGAPMRRVPLSGLSHWRQFYVIGQTGLFTIAVLDQTAQLSSFIARGEIASALLYSIDIYEGRILDKSANSDLRARISGKIRRNVNELVEHYKSNILVLQRACVATSHFNLLYNTVYPRLEKDPLSRSIFLELLDEIISDELLDQPPASLFSQFELAVTKLPIDRLDIHQVITTCRQNQLFDGIIYVMNHALLDYSTPLEEMFANLQRFVNKEVLSDCEIVQGNKLLLYLNCCLAGRAYPFGYLPENLCELVPMETYKFLIQLRPKSASSLQSNAELASDCSFPNLRLLLKFDARQFLNVICTCGDAPLFANSDGRLKRLVDILVGIVESANEGELNELGCMLLPFITTLLQKSAIPKDIHLFMQLIQYVLTHPIVDLLRSVPEIDHDQILQLALPLPYTRDHSPGSPTSCPGTPIHFPGRPTHSTGSNTYYPGSPPYSFATPTNSTGSPINFPGTPSYPPGILITLLMPSSNLLASLATLLPTHLPTNLRDLF
uniref:Vacuolar protein sorting-associated protein 8 central domain-containing protein n=1 Tax=Ditylenchus dipsaci TaxID=166011 RepID=A0A915CMM3_9BILA